MIYSVFFGAICAYMLWTGSLPFGRYPFWAGSGSGVRSSLYSGRGDLYFRIAGGIGLAAVILPDSWLQGWYGGGILPAAVLLFIVIGIVASLSGRAL